MSFNTGPDFENPADEGADNTYELTVSVSDGSLSAAKSFTVTITDDPSDNPNTEPTCDVYITEGDIAIQNAEQCEMTRGGLFREFIKYVPQSINANNVSAPIVFVLHGYTSYDDWIFDYANFQTQADEHGLILIFPQGSIYQPTQATHWNVGGWTSQSTTMTSISSIQSLILGRQLSCQSQPDLFNRNVKWRIHELCPGVSVKPSNCRHSLCDGKHDQSNI